MCDSGAWESGQGERKREGEQLLRREVNCARLAGSGAMSAVAGLSSPHAVLQSSPYLEVPHVTLATITESTVKS